MPKYVVKHGAVDVGGVLFGVGEVVELSADDPIVLTVHQWPDGLKEAAVVAAAQDTKASPKK